MLRVLHSSHPSLPSLSLVTHVRPLVLQLSLPLLPTPSFPHSSLPHFASSRRNNFLLPETWLGDRANHLHAAITYNPLGPPLFFPTFHTSPPLPFSTFVVNPFFLPLRIIFTIFSRIEFPLPFFSIEIERIFQVIKKRIPSRFALLLLEKRKMW